MVQKVSRLYIPKVFQAKTCLVLDKNQSHYLTVVMRCKEKDKVHVFNGRDGEWLAEISKPDKNAVQLKLINQRLEQPESEDIWLLFSPLKKERTDYAVEKASELGVKKIIPTRMRHSNNGHCRIDRLKALAIEASEQCERLGIPEIEERQDLEKVLVDWPQKRLLLVCVERFAGKIQRKPLLPLLMQYIQNPIAFAIGPEGGWHSDEIAFLAQKPYVRFVSLGTHVLRAETAVVSALSAFHLVRSGMDLLYS